VPPDELARGIRFEVDRGGLEAQVEPDDPIVDLEIEMPYPITRFDAEYWSKIDGSFGTVRLRIDGRVKMVENIIEFIPTDPAVRFLTSANQHHFGNFPRARYLARLRLRSQWIWVKGEAGPVYLNAEHLGVTGPTTQRELALKERDPQRAGDLDMFFYLVLRS
jgi:hypothetical protein